jgi:hypothetical protein
MTGRAARELSFTVSGHPGIRGTHRKTLEFNREPAVGVRETCVVGAAPARAWPERMPLAGPVTVTISCAGLTDALTGVANPAWSGQDRFVVRRSAALWPNTAVALAGKAAGDLRRDLVNEMRAARAEITVEVEEAGASPAENAALFVTRAQPDAPDAPAVDGVARASAGADLGGLAARLERGEHILLILDEPPGQPEVAAAKDAALALGARIRLLGDGWSVPEVAFFRGPGVAAPPAGETTFTGSRARLTRFLRESWAERAASAIRTPSRLVPAALGRLADLGMTADATVGTLPPDDRTWSGPPARLADALADQILGPQDCVLYAPARDLPGESLRDATDDRLRELLASRSLPELATRLAEETGRPRRACYARLLAIRNTSG